MNKLDSHLIPDTSPITPEKYIVRGEGYRISVLEDRLFRVETNAADKFIDEATQSVWHRDFGADNYSVITEERLLRITTSCAELHFDTDKKKVVGVKLKDELIRANNRGNLKGTARTLDMSVGKFQFLIYDNSKPFFEWWVKLGNGVAAKSGVAVLEDDSLILKSDGGFAPREGGKDIYIFAYGKDYRAAVNGYYRLSGNVPLIPRFALGNWWSRYKAYTDKEYLSLMRRFKEENIPITVATIDMDWHWVKPRDRFDCPMGKFSAQGAGWTGYSFNTELFPDYKGFLRQLKEEGYRITLNLHPHSGVRAFEDMYEDMCSAMGVDPATQKAIDFDIANPRFVNAYFKIIHKPYEADGVDFWWIDWQQGKRTAIKGLDPLWALNHYHTLDNAVSADGRKKQPLILSRFAGAGAHRYQVGFSGDTAVRWASLKYQPYFTANAANIGYTWWSHDIGGHMFGVNDAELYIRWLQFGVFSPINRLHSTKSELMGKEPWKKRGDIAFVAKEFLRLRHRLIPYLYTMNYLTHTKGRALCEPMYYSYPNDADAYKYKNQYMFGTELMVCPITSKTHKTGLAKVKAWLPEGRWTDFFTGASYEGGRRVTLCRDTSSIPVLAKEGAIIPLGADADNGTELPDTLEVAVFSGNGSFSLYEDDGESANVRHAITQMNIKEKEDGYLFEIIPAVKDDSPLPETRSYTIVFRDIAFANAEISAGGVQVETIVKDGVFAVLVKDVPKGQGITIKLTDCRKREAPDLKERAVEMLTRLEGSNLLKSIRFIGISRAKTDKALLAAIRRSIFPRHIKQAILEYYKK